MLDQDKMNQEERKRLPFMCMFLELIMSLVSLNFDLFGLMVGELLGS